MVSVLERVNESEQRVWYGAKCAPAKPAKQVRL